MEKYNREEAIKAQKEYCIRKELPMFAPSDGFCFRCYRDIYGVGGIEVEGAANHHITCCPFCGRSFCD